LFDAHPQLLVYPGEMKVGYPSKSNWPTFDPSEPPERLFAMLYHWDLAEMARTGYLKLGALPQDAQPIPFAYSAVAHARGFLDSLAAQRSVRTVMDAYFSALFLAWQPDRLSEARYFAGFVPRMGRNRASITSFFECYPDGRLAVLMRDPADWFVSVREHRKLGEVRWGNLDKEADNWNRMADAVLWYREQYGERCRLVSFARLVTAREQTMRELCDWAGVAFDPSLLEQTFAGRPTVANTNFSDPPEHLALAVLARRDLLTDQERQRIYELTARRLDQLHAIGWT